MKDLVHRNCVRCLLLAGALVFSLSCERQSLISPVCTLEISPKCSVVFNPFILSVEKSTDEDSYSVQLKVRWDWESDGVWDTDYSSQQKIYHQFTQYGYTRVTAEVMDRDGLVATDTDTVLLFPIPEPGTFTDPRDGNQYKTVKLFDTWWFAENLRYGKWLESTIDPTDNKIPEYYLYNDDPANLALRGGLYTFDEAMNYPAYPSDRRGICPEGWRIPSINDWYHISYDKQVPTMFIWNFYGPDGLGGLDLDYDGKFDWPFISDRDYFPNKCFSGIGQHGIFWTSSWFQYGPDEYSKTHFSLSQFATFIRANPLYDDSGMPFLNPNTRSFMFSQIINWHNQDGSISMNIEAHSVRCVKDDQ
jgi:hypothetical protein